MDDAEAALDALIERYSPDIAALGRWMVSRMRERLPQANALVFDTYNALGVGFAAGESAAKVIVSVVLYPRWVNLFFFRGALLDDPENLLQGSGAIIRHIRMTERAAFERPAVEALIVQALDLAQPPLDPAAIGRLIIKSVAKRQRPRRLA